ncbi:DUF5131 family protein [Geobacter pickeringii]|uniref:DUF5131 family protein n=1 Tax=Geobacter pickeringii TaxID=345632 RepID=UPI000689541A|nr:DUF5131 family protein [Geobacter pickeringii]
MFEGVGEGRYWDEEWEVIVRRTAVSPEALWRPAAEKTGKAWLVGGDLFHPGLPLEDVDRILSAVASNPQHLFIAVTDRPELSLARLYGITAETPRRLLEEDDSLHNLWFLVRMRDQAEADLRIPATIALKNCWVADGVRWPVVGVLAEPLRGSLDLRQVNTLCVAGFGSIDWVVCGAPAGDGLAHRQGWVRGVRDQADERGIPFFRTGRGGDADPLPDDERRYEVPPFRAESTRLHIFDHCRVNRGREELYSSGCRSISL